MDVTDDGGSSVAEEPPIPSEQVLSIEVSASTPLPDGNESSQRESVKTQCYSRYLDDIRGYPGTCDSTSRTAPAACAARRSIAWQATSGAAFKGSEAARHRPWTMGKKGKAKTAASTGSTKVDGAPAFLSKKAKAASLSAVLNVETIVRDDSRWKVEGDAIFETLLAVEAAVKKVRQLQCSWPTAIPHRDAAAFSGFADWLTENGVDMAEAPFEVGRAGSDETVEENATLFATRDIQEGDTFVTVPPALMMSSKTALTSSVGKFLSAVPALRANPSMTLSLHLLVEALDESSFFRPYIRVLPAKFSIPTSLPFSASQLLSLRPSPAFARAVRTLRSQLMQYTKIYAVLAKKPSSITSPTVEMFSYDNFEWAVSVVMTRQNQFPSAVPGQPSALALVPVWDMCNHAVGEHTTSVLLDPTTDEASVECAAMRTFEKGDAITIFYGNRPNVELLLYSGFVQADNEFDQVLVPIRFDAEDRRENVAKVVLARRELHAAGLEAISGVDDNGSMTLAGSVSGKDGGCVDEVLATVARVRATALDGGDTGGDGAVGTVEVLVNAINQVLKTYETSRPVDQESSGVAEGLVCRLHSEEKRILCHALTELERVGIPAISAQ